MPWPSFGRVGVTTSRSPHKESSWSSSLRVDPEGDLPESEVTGSEVVVLDSPELQDGDRQGGLGTSL